MDERNIHLLMATITPLDPEKTELSNEHVKGEKMDFFPFCTLGYKTNAYMMGTTLNIERGPIFLLG